MATVLNEKSKSAIAIREAAEYLYKKGISIAYRGEGVLVSIDGETFVLLEAGVGITSEFPPQFDGTRIQPIEHYIRGT